MHSVQKMRPIATDITRSVVCVSVCLPVSVLCINSWTDRDAIRGADTCRP